MTLPLWRRHHSSRLYGWPVFVLAALTVWLAEASRAAIATGPGFWWTVLLWWFYFVGLVAGWVVGMTLAQLVGDSRDLAADLEYQQGLRDAAFREPPGYYAMMPDGTWRLVP